MRDFRKIMFPFAMILALCAGCASQNALWRDLERAAGPSSVELQQTHFALIGEIVAPEGRFHVAVQRLVRTGMLAPRGQKHLLLFDTKRRLTASYWLMSAEPLWCEGSRVYLWGQGLAYNVPVDPRIYALYPEETAEGGNVIEFSRGVHQPYITREKRYGSSGGIEDDPWKDNDPGDIAKKIRLDGLNSLVVRRRSEDHGAVVEIMFAGRVAKSFMVGNGWAERSVIESVHLDPSSDEVEYLICIPDRSSTYGAETGIIVYRLQWWEFLLLPDDRFSVEDIDGDGVAELRCERIQNKTYSFVRGVLHEKKGR